MTKGQDVYDVTEPMWCSLCEAPHWPCETNEWGVDIGALPELLEDEEPG